MAAMFAVIPVRSFALEVIDVEIRHELDAVCARSQNA
jgi:hypothetical protein